MKAIPSAREVVCHLQPPAYKGQAGKSKWMGTGRTVGAAASPAGEEVASWVMAGPSKNPNESRKITDQMTIPDRAIWVASPNILPPALVNLYTESYTLFISLQNIVASSMRLPQAIGKLDAHSSGIAEVWDKDGNLIGVEGLLGPPGAETIGHMRRLVGMYLEEIGRVRDGDVDADLQARFEAIYHIFQLSETLYLPQDGRGEGLLGEELLDWVNEVDPAPENSQGNEIMSSSRPWEHPSFWAYINQCILRGFHLPAASFLRTLQHHGNSTISKIGTLLAAHLTQFPRSHNTTAYPLDHQFLLAHRSWLSKFRAELAASTGGRPRGKWLDQDGKWSDVEEGLRAIVELMEGKEDRIYHESTDWREAVGAFGLLCDVEMRRDDLPGIMKRILAKLPVDRSIVDFAIQADLCAGNIVKALLGCHDLDIWLAAHLGDVFDKLALIPDDEEKFESSLRDHFLLEYTDILIGNPAHGNFWRIIADYLSAAGDEGRSRLRTFIIHVVVNDHKDQGVEKLKELRETCIDLRLEGEWKIIAGIMADRFMRLGEYGLAATMCQQAEDRFALGRIAEKLLEEFIRSGEHQFLAKVETLPPTLLNEATLAMAEMRGTTGISTFAARLAFLAEFRDHLLFKAEGAKDQAAAKVISLMTSGIVPTGFQAVLLVENIPLLEDTELSFTANDTFELMRVTEEILSGAVYAPEDYLGQLELLLKSRGGKKDITAMRKMDEVRLALARNLARAMVVDFDSPF